MARVTVVKHAQQRYETVPVLDEDGQPKRVPVMNSRTGEQKTNKHGRPVFRTLTVEDHSKPKPNRKCDRCGVEIKVGDPYKWIAPKSGPYGGRKMYRCGTCPSWQVWEYSSSLSARLAQISYNAFEQAGSVESPEDVEAILTEAADEVRSLAGEKREAAQNIEDGFQHETYQSQELNEQADSLESWADEIESVDVPDLPEPEEGECETCAGDGADPDDPSLECSECNGTGRVTPDEPTDEQMDEWRSEVEDVLSIIDESPV